MSIDPTPRRDTRGARDPAADPTKPRASAPSLRLRRKPADRAPLVRISWPGQPVLGSLDFDDTEAQ